MQLYGIDNLTVKLQDLDSGLCIYESDIKYIKQQNLMPPHEKAPPRLKLSPLFQPLFSLSCMRYCTFLSVRKRQLALLVIVFSLSIIKSLIKSNYPESTTTHSETPNHPYPKNSNTFPKEFCKNSQRIPLEFSKNIQKISNFQFPIPKEFPKNVIKIQNKIPKNFIRNAKKSP